jgi:hypothetical protein
VESFQKLVRRLSIMVHWLFFQKDFFEFVVFVQGNWATFVNSFSERDIPLANRIYTLHFLNLLLFSAQIHLFAALSAQRMS